MADKKDITHSEIINSRKKAEEKINKIVKNIEENLNCGVELELHKENKKSGERFPKTKYVQIKINI